MTEGVIGYGFSSLKPYLDRSALVTLAPLGSGCSDLSGIHDGRGKCSLPVGDYSVGKVIEEEWPKMLDSPTASEKTACMNIALDSLAAQAHRRAAPKTSPKSSVQAEGSTTVSDV